MGQLPSRYTLDWSGWQPGNEQHSPRLIKRQLLNGNWVHVSYFPDPLEDDPFWFGVQGDSASSGFNLTESQIHLKVNAYAEANGGWKQ